MFDGNSAGIITVVNWTMAPDGARYLYFWCSNWEILTDKTIPVEGFRSTEHWQLAAKDAKGCIVALFPGCQIKAWVKSPESPPYLKGDGAACYFFV